MQTTLYAYPATLARDKAGRILVRFRDLPEALTDGATQEEALVEAVDCLSEALMSRIADDEAIPPPSPPMRGEHQVAPEPTVALKVALNTVAREARVSAAELARRLRVDHKEARRLLDPRHASKLPRLADALNALGHEVKITVHDASKRERLLTSPAEPKPRRPKLERAARVAPR
jgi:antitoxin HicB